MNPAPAEPARRSPDFFKESRSPTEASVAGVRFKTGFLKTSTPTSADGTEPPPLIGRYFGCVAKSLIGKRDAGVAALSWSKLTKMLSMLTRDANKLRKSVQCPAVRMTCGSINVQVQMGIK